MHTWLSSEMVLRLSFNFVIIKMVNTDKKENLQGKWESISHLSQHPNKTVNMSMSPDIFWAWDGCTSCSPGTQAAAAGYTRNSWVATCCQDRQKSLSFQYIWLHQESILNAYKGIKSPHPNGFISFPATHWRNIQARPTRKSWLCGHFPGRASLHYLPTPAQLATPAAGPRRYLWLCKIMLRTGEWELLNPLS